MTSQIFSNLSDCVIKGQNLLVLLKATSLIINFNYAFGLWARDFFLALG